MNIQVVGLPCSGKSHYIEKIKSKYSFIKTVDIIQFDAPDREQKCINFIKNTSSEDSLILIESACGIQPLDCKVILVSTSAKKHKVYMKKRNCNYSIDNFSSIRDQIIPANYTVYSYFAFENLIKSILSGDDNAKRFFRNTRNSSI